MSKENIKIERFEDKGFVKVECMEGHYITNWDKQNILDFSDAKVMYCPLNYDLDAYYCLTDEEHNKYTEELEMTLKELEMNNNN